MADAIRVKNLYKHFGSGDTLVRVIEGADFSVQKGELVVLIAPSGAGKTTLLMMIGCVEEPTSGKIWLGEELVYDNRWLTKEKRKIRREKIGFIFQAHYLIPFLNVIENVTLVPQTNGVPEKEANQTAMQLLEYFDIGDKAHSMPEVRFHSVRYTLHQLLLNRCIHRCGIVSFSWRETFIFSQVSSEVYILFTSSSTRPR